MGYEILNVDNLERFLLGIDEIKKYFEGSSLDIKEIGDGNVNFVFLAVSKDDPTRSLIIKQAVPYLRCAGEEYPLSRERMSYEIRALKTYGDFIGDFVPKVYYADEKMSLVVMQNLSNHIIMRLGLIDGKKYPLFSEHISSFLANTLFLTSSLHLSSQEKREMMSRFNNNSELCKLTEDFVFTFPYMDHETDFIDEGMQEDAKILFKDMDFKREVLKLKYIFMTHTDALLHGDLHTGSIMINEKETFVIDPEFAFFGPFGFDIGAIIANLFSAAIYHHIVTKDNDYQEWIYKTVIEIYEKFEEKFLALWDKEKNSALITEGFIDEKNLSLFKKEFMQNIFKESIGFAGCKMARRVFGIAGVKEIRGIEDKTLRQKAERKALDIGVMMVKSHNKINSPKEFTEAVRERL